MKPGPAQAPDPEIDDEAVGFHAQQAIEKWIKAVMALHGLEEVRIHDLGRLLELLRGAGVELRPDVDRVDELTIYAVPMRYDELLDAEPLERDAAIALVEEVGEMGDHSTPLKTWSRRRSAWPCGPVPTLRLPRIGMLVCGRVFAAP